MRWNGGGSEPTGEENMDGINREGSDHRGAVLLRKFD
jgi:hypothetical protein